MDSRALSVTVVSAALAAPWIASCSAPLDDGTTGGVGASGGASGTSSGGAAGAAGASSGGAGVGGAAGALSGGTAGVAPGGGGTAGSTTAGAAGVGTAGVGTAGVGMGGAAGSGAAGAAGSGVAGSFVGGGMGGAPPTPALDCGGKGAVIENAGPPSNRVNYVIFGDGYTAGTQIDTTFISHVQTAMAKRFSETIGQVYLRYRKFVNICAVKIPSSGAICSGNSYFNCCGDDQSRLARCSNSAAVNTAIMQQLPANFAVDWRAIVLNGSSWWNTGSSLMLWSGGNENADGAALHEGGHGFHQLSDEYSGTSSDCGEKQEVNSTAANTGMANPKWGLWVGFTQTPGTGMQGFFQGSRYCSNSSGQYRPSQNSMMNSLLGDNVNTAFNAVSREKMIFDIWRIIESPIDSTNPPAGAVMNPSSLTVNVIDPAVISVDWSVDGNLVAMNGGVTYNIGAAGLSPGTHMVSAKAYDNAGMDLVRYRTGGTQYNRQYWGAPTAANMMRGSERTVSWTVTIP